MDVLSSCGSFCDFFKKSSKTSMIMIIIFYYFLCIITFDQLTSSI